MMISLDSPTRWLLNGLFICTVGLICFGNSDPGITFFLVGGIVLGLVFVTVERIKWYRLIRSGVLGERQITHVARGTLSPLMSLAILSIWVYIFITPIWYGASIEILGLTAIQVTLIATTLLFWELFLAMLPAEYAITDEGIWCLSIIDTNFIPFASLKEARHKKDYFLLFGKKFGNRQIYTSHKTYNTFSDFNKYIILHLNYPRTRSHRSRVIKQVYLLTPNNPTEFLSYLPTKLTTNFTE